jgi:hypothetical protein
MLQREETASHYSLFCLLLNEVDDSETIIQTVRERKLRLKISLQSVKRPSRRVVGYRADTRANFRKIFPWSYLAKLLLDLMLA